MKRSYIKHKKTEWDTVRAKLKIRFERIGITYCEKCGGKFALGFAHAVKRRKLSKFAQIGAPDHIETVTLLCNPCHDGIELGKSPEHMLQAVMSIIHARKEQP